MSKATKERVTLWFDDDGVARTVECELTEKRIRPVEPVVFSHRRNPFWHRSYVERRYNLGERFFRSERELAEAMFKNARDRAERCDRDLAEARAEQGKRAKALADVVARESAPPRRSKRGAR
jgi:hypothetical protein